VTGPAVGEALAQRSQWRWIFWLNLPFSITALGILAVFASLKARAPGSMIAQLRSYDWIGFGLLTGSLVGTNIGISWVSLIQNLKSPKTPGRSPEQACHVGECDRVILDPEGLRANVDRIREVQCTLGLTPTRCCRFSLDSLVSSSIWSGHGSRRWILSSV
jgi:hypothetical protein